MVHRCMQESYAAEVHVMSRRAVQHFEESKDCVAGSDVSCVRFVSGGGRLEDFTGEIFQW